MPAIRTHLRAAHLDIIVWNNVLVQYSTIVRQRAIDVARRLAERSGDILTAEHGEIKFPSALYGLPVCHTTLPKTCQLYHIFDSLAFIDTSPQTIPLYTVMYVS